MPQRLKLCDFCHLASLFHLIDTLLFKFDQLLAVIVVVVFILSPRCQLCCWTCAGSILSCCCWVSLTHLSSNVAMVSFFISSLSSCAFLHIVVLLLFLAFGHCHSHIVLVGFWPSFFSSLCTAMAAIIILVVISMAHPPWSSSFQRPLDGQFW